MHTCGRCGPLRSGCSPHCSVFWPLLATEASAGGPRIATRHAGASGNARDELGEVSLARTLGAARSLTAEAQVVELEGIARQVVALPFPVPHALVGVRIVRDREVPDQDLAPEADAPVGAHRVMFLGGRPVELQADRPVSGPVGGPTRDQRLERPAVQDAALAADGTRPRVGEP